MSIQRQRALGWLGLALLLLLAFAIRLHRLDAVHLRGDEGYTAIYWISTPFTSDWFTMAKGDPYPFGVFFTWWAWAKAVGDSAFVLRYLSVLGNIAGMAAVTVLARRLLNDWRLVGLVVLLWLFNPFYLWHAQDARMYGILSAVTTLSFYWFYRATDKASSDRSLRGWQPWWPYIVVQTLALYLYYFEIFGLIVQGAFLLALRRRDLLIEAIRAWALMLVLIIPMLVQLYIVTTVTDYLPNAEKATIGAYFEWFLPVYFLGEEAARQPLWYGLVGIVIVLTGLILTVDTNQRRSLFLGIWIILPPIILYAISLRAEYYRPRYAVLTLPALMIAGILALHTLGQRIATKRHAVLLPATAVLLLGMISAVEIYDYFYSDPPKARDWTSLADYLSARTTEYDVVVTGDPDPTLEYYYRGPGDVYFLPLEDIDVSFEVEQLVNDYQAVFTLAGAYIGDFQQAIQEQAQMIPGDVYPGVGQYRNWEVGPDEIIYPLDIQFGDIAVLRGYSVLNGGGTTNTLLLYWEPIRQTDTDFSILTHIVPANDVDGVPVAVVDHGVANSIISTTRWAPGALYRDPVAVSVPAGRYIIRVGLYESATQAPVEVINASNAETRYPVGEMLVTVD